MASGSISIDKGTITSQVNEPDGSITIKATLPCSENITLSATPAVGYELEYIKKNGTPKPSINATGDTYTWLSDEEPTLNVRFKKTVPVTPPSSYKVTVHYNSIIQMQEGAGGTVFPGPQTKEFEYAAGSTFTGIFSILPLELALFNFQGITVDNVFQVGVINTQNYTVSVLVNKDISIIAYSKLINTNITYKVYGIAGQGGIVTPASQTVNAGQNATVLVDPDTGKKIKSITRGTEALTGFPTDGSSYSVPVLNVNADISVVANFEDVSASSNVNTAVIEWIVSSRLISNEFGQYANLWQDSSYVNTSVLSRSVASNGIPQNPFVLPFNYYGTYLVTATTWSTPDGNRTVMDEFQDNVSNDYLRLAVHSIGKDGGSLYITTRLNNYWGNNKTGFAPGQVSKCEMKITDPDGTTTIYQHPVQFVGNATTDITHGYTLPKVGIYMIETETILAAGNKRTSYSKSFVSVENI